MPAKSQSQRALLNARFGHAWVKRHHFDNKGKLPAHVSKSSRSTGRTGGGTHSAHRRIIRKLRFPHK